MTESAIEDKLDRITKLLQLAFREQLASAREDLRRDPVNEALLEATAEDWIPAGQLKKTVSESTRQSDRTVARRIAELVSEGALEIAGSGPSVRYRSSGLL